ncbi:MAG TPA: hypothetical protein VJ476_03700 [Rhizomicrobium sp.]|nr:hypothetical protein [Rhizomicrobium sp.]
MTVRMMAAFAFAVAMACVLAPARADDGWVTVTNAAGTFHYASPVTPKSETSRGDDGGVGMTQTIFTSVAGGFIEIGDDTTYDPGPHVVDPKLVLNGFVESIKGQLISSQDEPYVRGPNDTLPGLLASIANSDVTCHFRVVGDGVRAFALAACARAGTDATADIDRAMASFTVTKP